MRSWGKVLVGAAVLSLSSMAPSSTALAQFGDSDPGYASLAGKRVVYIPIAMNYDITQAWHAGMEREAERFGYEIIVRDPNWDTNAAVQAFQAAIREKPDLIVTLPPDTTSLSRLVSRAQSEGIPVIEIQQITSNPPDVFVGTDWKAIGTLNAQAMVERCASDSAPGKVVMVTGPTNAPASINWVNGAMEVLEGRSDISVVSTQAANWDASKSNAIVSTTLQQHADLCGVLDVWDGDASGSAAAIREAGKLGEVALITAGGGATSACEAVTSGTFSSYVSFDAATQASYLNALIKLRLQSDVDAGSAISVVYTPDKVLTQDNVSPADCWTVEAIRASGG